MLSNFTYHFKTLTRGDALTSVGPCINLPWSIDGTSRKCFEMVRTVGFEPTQPKPLGYSQLISPGMAYACDNKKRCGDTQKITHNNGYHWEIHTIVFLLLAPCSAYRQSIVVCIFQWGSCRDRTYDLRLVRALLYRWAKEPNWLLWRWTNQGMPSCSFSTL